MRALDLQSLFISHKEKLGRFLKRRGCSEDTAADLAQDAFARMLRQSADVAIENPSSYLFRIAANLVTDLNRRERLVDYIADPDPAIAALVDDAPAPLRIVEGREQIRLLETALAELPDRCRRIFILSRVQNVPHRKIASIFGVTTRTVENEIARALKHCAARLHENSDIVSD
ncbi:RNA polymerase sigma factor [Terrihabitans sp. B22-R8]|uniref:RNA polymerase sigma factor n=1 Tax=Terrihabitans sp. B22-R8 TaxID=3425128 RepID=UPI00403C013A